MAEQHKTVHELKEEIEKIQEEIDRLEKVKRICVKIYWPVFTLWVIALLASIVVNILALFY